MARLLKYDEQDTYPAVVRRTGKQEFDLAQLKRFARHRGPSLGDLRALSSIQPLQNCLLTLCILVRLKKENIFIVVDQN